MKQKTKQNVRGKRSSFVHSVVTSNVCLFFFFSFLIKGNVHNGTESFNWNEKSTQKNNLPRAGHIEMSMGIKQTTWPWNTSQRTVIIQLVVHKRSADCRVTDLTLISAISLLYICAEFARQSSNRVSNKHKYTNRREWTFADYPRLIEFPAKESPTPYYQKIGFRSHGGKEYAGRTTRGNDFVRWLFEHQFYYLMEIFCQI